MDSHTSWKELVMSVISTSGRNLDYRRNSSRPQSTQKDANRSVFLAPQDKVLIVSRSGGLDACEPDPSHPFGMTCCPVQLALLRLSGYSCLPFRTAGDILLSRCNRSLTFVRDRKVNGLTIEGASCCIFSSPPCQNGIFSDYMSSIHCTLTNKEKWWKK